MNTQGMALMFHKIFQEQVKYCSNTKYILVSCMLSKFTRGGYYRRNTFWSATHTKKKTKKQNHSTQNGWSECTYHKDSITTHRTLWPLPSMCIFSILFSLHFLWWCQGEFVSQSRASLSKWSFLSFFDLNFWIRDDIVKRNKIIVSFRRERVTVIRCTCKQSWEWVRWEGSASDLIFI